MGVRRVVTGHSSDGKALVADDEEVAPVPIGAFGSATTLLWGRDDLARFPDDGAPPSIAAALPPPGGSRLAMMELAPQGDDFDHFVRDALEPWADPDNPGMHRTPSIDYDIVLTGTVGLELDDGTEVLLGPGDVVVQNGTRHRWHNRGDVVARVASVMIGGHHEVIGGSRLA
jgi:mannose-6-phosphate isomerase-like protein (cupin superfamily)